MRRPIATIAALFAVTFLSLPAQASVFISPRLGAPDPGPGPGERLVVSFDAANVAGFTWDGVPNSRIGSLAGVAAAPAGVTGRFGFVSTGAGQPRIATLRTPALRSISFYWGSVDAHNRVAVLDGAGRTLMTLDGNQLGPANGSWTASLTNRRVGFHAGPGVSIGGLRFIARGTAFEFDSIAALGVPEPASWALMIAGFGLTGLAARRQSRALSRAAAR